MPSRNIIRQDAPDSYYHVYARGASKQTVFKDHADKDYFLYLIARHLSVEPQQTKAGYRYPHYRDEIELLTYCLMDNHFHLLVYQTNKHYVQYFMKSILTAYSMYFNRRYKRTGSLFENRYKASRITSQYYLEHISRYIHLNPRSWQRYKHSSFKDIVHNTEPEWLSSDKVLLVPGGRAGYAQFVADYEDRRTVLAQIKDELANM